MMRNQVAAGSSMPYFLVGGVRWNSMKQYSTAFEEDIKLLRYEWSHFMDSMVPNH